MPKKIKPSLVFIKPYKMPRIAKKSVTASAVSATPAMPFAAPQPSFAASSTPAFQFPATFTPPTGFAFGATSAPQPTYIPVSQIPVATPVAHVPAATENTSSAVQPIEAQMKMMREYLTNMEKTFKEAKKGLKKSQRTPKDPNAPKREMPEGTKAWNAYVNLVHTETNQRLRATDPTKAAADEKWMPFSYKQAMSEAKRLRDLGDPRAPKKAEKPAPTPAAPGEEKKRGRKPKAAAVPTPATNMAMPAFNAGAVPGFNLPFTIPTPATAPATASEDDDSLEEIEIAGKLYAMSKKNECWFMTEEGEQGEWAGIYNAALNTITPAPEPK